MLVDLTTMTAAELDAFAGGAHAYLGTDYVEIVEGDELVPHALCQRDASHGANHPDEMTV